MKKLTKISTVVSVMAIIGTSSFMAIADSGQNIYEETCSACHGDNGKGAIDAAPDFTKPDGRLSKSDKVLIKHITEGFQTEGSQMAMPEKGGNEDLTDKDIKNVLKYMKKKFKK